MPETVTATYGTSADIIISKFDSAGIYLWSRRLGGVNGDKGYGITADSNRNIIVTGLVAGSADLNADGDSTDIDIGESAAGYGAGDIFISRFNSSGTYQWSERLGGTDVGSGECGYYIKADTVGDIIITGVVRGNADLNGDEYSGDATDGTGGLSGEIASSVYHYNDVFVVKFQEIEPDNNYIYQWSRRLGGDSSDYGYGVAIDTFNNSVVITGITSDNADLNGDADSSDGGAESAAGYGSDDAFITKFTSGGTFLWSKRNGGVTSDAGYCTATDSGRNSYIIGYVSGSADLNCDGDFADGKAETGSGFGGLDVFFGKFDSEGQPQ